MILKDPTVRYWTRWFCLPAILLGQSFFIGIALMFICAALGLWLEPTGGFILALLWVVSAYFVAPSRKLTVAILAFVIGAIISWKTYGESWYPEDYSKPYEPTHIPIIITYLGGLIGVVITYSIDKKKNSKCEQPK